jgi:hypothetical protein
LPEAIADEHHVLAARPILVGREVPPERRLEAERRQQRRRCIHPEHLLRIATPRQGERVERRQRQVAEDFLPLLHFEEAGMRKSRARQVLLLVGGAEAHQAIRLGVGQRAQEHRIDHAEQRHVRADPERQAEHRHERKPWRLDQLADGIAQLGVHVGSLSGLLCTDQRTPAVQ